MPPKRKIDETEDKASSSVSKMTKLIDTKPTDTKPTVDGEYKGPIKYDEYMEGGIPDSLLAGLGFSDDLDSMTRVSNPPSEDEEDEGCQVVENMADERVQEEVRESYVESPILIGNVHSLANVKTAVVKSSPVSNTPTRNLGGLGKPGGITPQQYLDLVLGSKTNSSTHSGNRNLAPRPPVVENKSNVSSRSTASSVGGREARVAVSSVGVREAQRAPVQQSRRADSGASQFSDQSAAMIQAAALDAVRSMKVNSHKHKSYPTVPRTITKGNIVYERMSTGEVIASLVKDNGGGSTPQGGLSRISQPSPHSASHVQSQGTTQQHRPAARNSSLPTPRKQQQLAPAAAPPSMLPAPDNCPINEYNVSDVLERSIKATQSMRLLLTSLRDDLKRVGASSSAMVTPEQVSKKKEVAEKLSKAYATYKKTIENIGTGVSQRGYYSTNNLSIATGAMRGGGNQRGGVSRPSAHWRGRGGRPVNYSIGRGAPPPAHQGSSRGTGRGYPMPRPISSLNVVTDNGGVSTQDGGLKMSPGDLKTSPGVKVTGQSTRGRGRKRSSRDVIELSDSEEDEEKMILGSLPKDVLSERRSRDQRAADRAALRSASIEAKVKARKSGDATAVSKDVAAVVETDSVQAEMGDNTLTASSVDKVKIEDSPVTNSDTFPPVSVVSDTATDDPEHFKSTQLTDESVKTDNDHLESKPAPTDPASTDPAPTVARKSEENGD